MSVRSTPSSVLEQPSNGHRAFDVRSAFVVAWVMLLLLHPIAASDFWWQVARGRAVWEGKLAPSRALLANELNTDADWLGGVPWFLLYRYGGPAILSIVVVTTAVLVAVRLVRSPRPPHDVARRSCGTSTRMLLVFLGFAAARQAWAPTPGFFDLLGVLAVWSLAGHVRRQARWPRIAALLLCECCWANFGTVPLLGPVVALLRLNLVESDEPQAWTLRPQLAVLISLFVVGSLTPRGLWTNWDVVRLLFPWSCAESGTLGVAGILPHIGWPPTVEVTAFLILLAINLFLLVQKSSAATWTDFFLTTASVVVAGSSTANLGAASLLLTLRTIQLAERREVTGPAWNRLRFLGPVLATAFSIIVAGGFWPGMQTRLGWGLAPQLEPAILEQTLAGLSFPGTAYCTGAREAGFLAWFRPGEVRPNDFPTRALLSGRLNNHVSLGWELANGWRDQHRRSDGTWGGWLKRFRESHIRLLMISADDTAVIRALEPTPWKPLAIDSPSLPYGVAVDPKINRKLAELQNLLDVAEMGEWTYPAPSPSGTGSHFDLWGLLTGEHDLRGDIRQSRTFVGMNRHVSGLKVLAHGLRRKDPAVQREFSAIQLSLAYRDFLAAGQATGWRLSACLESGADPAIVSRFNPRGTAIFSELPPGFQSAVAAYRRRDFDEAKQALSPGSSESLFALLQISLEEGNPKQASSWLKELELKFPESAEFEAAHESLAQFFR